MSRRVHECHEGEVLHLRHALDYWDGLSGPHGEAIEIAAGYYVLRELLAFREDVGVSFAIISQAGEDEDGQMVAGGETQILPWHRMAWFVGTGMRAREPFLRLAGARGEGERNVRIF